MQVRPSGVDLDDEPTALLDVAAATYRYEHVEPIRRFASRRGMPNLHCRFASAKSGRSLWCESRTEMLVLLGLEADASVASMATQPFRFRWCVPGEARVRTGVPDVAVRLVEGGLLVIDTTFDRERDKPERRLRQEAAAELCAEHGLRYEVRERPPVAAESSLWAGLAAARYPDASCGAAAGVLRSGWATGLLASRESAVGIADLPGEAG